MGLARTIWINLVVFLSLFCAAELAARTAIWWIYGSQAAGMPQRQRYLSYRPFVMYGPDWDHTFISLKPPAPGICRVMLLGGSVAEGFPSNALEEALTASYGHPGFEVINAASGGYEARQEVVVASLWGPRVAPNLLLSLDGANDLEHRLRVRKAGGFYLSPTYEAYLSKPYLAPFYYLLSQSQLFNGMLRILARVNLGKAEEYLDAIPVYVDAEDSLNAIAKGMGAARMMVLQPFSAYKSPPSPEEAAFTLYKYREEVMKRLYSDTHVMLAQLSDRKGIPYVDARFIYEQVHERIFIDDVHLTSEGYRRLAEEIAHALKASWPAECTR